MMRIFFGISQRGKRIFHSSDYVVGAIMNWGCERFCGTEDNWSLVTVGDEKVEALSS